MLLTVQPLSVQSWKKQVTSNLWELPTLSDTYWQSKEWNCWSCKTECLIGCLVKREAPKALSARERSAKRCCMFQLIVNADTKFACRIITKFSTEVIWGVGKAKRCCMFQLIVNADTRIACKIIATFSTLPSWKNTSMCICHSLKWQHKNLSWQSLLPWS